MIYEIVMILVGVIIGQEVATFPRIMDTIKQYSNKHVEEDPVESMNMVAFMKHVLKRTIYGVKKE